MTQEPKKAIVRRVWDETPRLKGAVLEVDPDVAAMYQRPGQVLVLRPTPEDKIYMAIASSPGEARGFEILLGENSLKKAPLAEGQTIDIDPPMGKGFPLEIAQGRDVLLFAVGSAIAPIRPVIEFLRRRRAQYERIRLYVGAHSESDFPYRKDYASWAADAIDIVPSISKPWVQERFSLDPIPLERAVAFICGMKAMMDDCTRVLTEAGLSLDRIGRNW